MKDSNFLSQVANGVLFPMTVIYVILFMTGVIGNFAVCFVIVKNKSMHTAINYYLFSLAVSDLMILVLGRTRILFVCAKSSVPLSLWNNCIRA